MFFSICGTVSSVGTVSTEQLPGNQQRLQRVTSPSQEVVQHVIARKSGKQSLLRVSFSAD